MTKKSSKCTIGSDPLFAVNPGVTDADDEMTRLGIDPVKLLAETDLFGELAQEPLLALARQARARQLAAKEILFVEGDNGDCGYIVVSGRIALVKTSPNGKELIAELLPPGEMFAVPVVVNNRPFPVTARAQVPSVVLALPRSALLPLVESDPQLVKRMMKIMTDRMAASLRLSRALAHDRVEVRISHALISLIPRFGGQSTLQPEIAISRQELADITGTTIESASRVVHGLGADGILDVADQRRVKIMNLGKVRELAEL